MKDARRGVNLWNPKKAYPSRDMTKTGMEWKTESQIKCLNFVEKLYFTTVDLLCRYKSEKNIV